MLNFEEKKLEAIRRRKEERQYQLIQARKKQKVLIGSFFASIALVGVTGYVIYTKPAPEFVVDPPSARKVWTKPKPAPKPVEQVTPKEKNYTIIDEDITPSHMQNVKELVLGEAYSDLDTLELKMKSPSLAGVPELSEQLKLRHKALKEKIRFYENIDPNNSSTWPTEETNQIP